ncbi:MAG: AraC family transcriptional regulator [Halioglobus sp.]
MSAAGSRRSIDSLMLPTQLSLLLLQLAEPLGARPTAVLHGTGLSPADLENHDTWISYRQSMKIIENAYQQTGSATLGLEVGSAEDISTFGILGYAMLSCATVGEAIAVGEKYQRTAQAICDTRLEIRENSIAMAADTPFVVKPECYRFAVEALFSGIMEILRILTGEEFYPIEIQCVYEDPGYRELYKTIFRCPVEFGAPANRVVVDRAFMDLPVLQANKFNARMSEKMCEEILHKYVGEKDLTTRIRHIILRVPGQFPDEAAVADALTMSARTLRRQLSALDTSYRELLDQVRAELAQQYLQNSGLKVEQVALLLGYTETTNFRRAFKRWLGVSPQDYRLQLAQGSTV